MATTTQKNCIDFTCGRLDVDYHLAFLGLERGKSFYLQRVFEEEKKRETMKRGRATRSDAPCREGAYLRLRHDLNDRMVVAIEIR